MTTSLKNYVVTFDDWTTYRFTVDAHSEDEAIECAKAAWIDDPGQLNVLDGGTENFEATLAPSPGAKAGAQ